MANELPRPGVQILQSTATPSPSVVRPTLVPCVVGPAFEVINAINTDGTINSKAKFGVYAQLGLAITESSFPNPRNNIDELDVLEETIRPFMLQAGVLNALRMSPGSSFLAAEHGSGKPAVSSAVFNGGTGLALAGTVLVLAIDQPVRLNTADDIVVSFTGSGNLSSATAAAQINAAAGQTVARVAGTSPNDAVEIFSPTYGALSSVTVRAGGSANTLLALGYSAGSSAHEQRMEGSGWRAQDQNNNTTQSPWIEFYQGAYLLDGTDTTFATGFGLYLTTAPSTLISAKASAVTFGTSGGKLNVQVGDYFFADGMKVGGGAEIMKVEAARLKLGTINTALSTADAYGNYTNKVYDVATVGTVFDPAPFAPQYVYFVANSLVWSALAPTPGSTKGATAGTAATAGSIVGVGATFPVSLAGLGLHYISTINGVATEGTFVFTGGPFTTGALVATAIGSSIPGVVASVDTSSPPQLKLTSSSTGAASSVVIKADGSANSALGFSSSSDATGAGTDLTFTGLTAQVLSFQFDNNSHTFNVVMTSDSAVDAVSEINAEVGAVVASIAGSNLALTSPLSGVASSVTVVSSGTDAAHTFGLDSTSSPTVTAGTGRPLPDAYLDDAGVLHIQSELLRDLVTGYPLDQAFNTGTLYIQFKALRKDVTAVAQVSGVLRLSDIGTLTAVLDPITEDNPLALGLFLAMLNAPTFEVKGLGVDEVTAAAPYGTSDAYARAAAMLESEEVYAIAPLTQDEVVASLWLTHVDTMSSPEQGGERIVFINKVVPHRANPTVALSGTQANSTATSNQILLDGSPASGLVAAGINPAQPIPETAGVYAEFEVAGQLVRYSVSSVSGALVNFRVTFSSPTTNIDGFYTTTPFTASVVDAAYSLAVRGASLNIPGSNPPILDYGLVSTNVSAANSAYGNRRGFSVFPDTINTVISAIEKSLPGFYACAATVGMCAALSPQQPFTNYPITGITGVVGTEKFTKSELNVMAGGGTYILIQDSIGGPVVCRHQLSTDTSSIETRELSITKVVDFVAKMLRAAIRKFIGRNVINKNLLDAIGTTIFAVLTLLEETGVINGTNLNQIIQDPVNPDTVLVDVTLDVPYPCNYIKLTLVV